MSFAIFRVQGIKTTNDLRGIGKHNVERKSETNKDIDETKTADNIHLISADKESNSYLKKFFRTVEPMKEQHDEKMKTERKDRVKSFEAKINSSKNDVACEFLFTSDEKFFEGKSKEDIREWAETSLDFIKNEVGIGEGNILHAVVHMDEKTPHLHIVAVPLVNKFDGRAKRDVWQINRKHFIPTKDDLSKLQDKYFEKMIAKGYDLERGLAANDTERKHMTTQEFKKQAIEKEVQALESDRKKLQEDVQAIVNALKGAKPLDDIKVQRAGLLDRNSVKMSVEDYESIKILAEGVEGLKTQNTSLNADVGLLRWQISDLKAEKENLKTENVNLKNKNEMLQTENEELKTTMTLLQSQVEHLKNTLDIIKNSLEKRFGIAKEKIRDFIGEARLHDLRHRFGKEHAFMPETIKNLIPEDERQGAEQYMAKINQKDIEKERKEASKVLEEKEDVSQTKTQKEPDMERG